MASFMTDRRNPLLMAENAGSVKQGLASLSARSRCFSHLLVCLSYFAASVAFVDEVDEVMKKEHI